MPPGLTVQNTYTELRKGNKKAVIVVHNNIAYPQTLWKKNPVARVAVVSPVLEFPKSKGLWEGIGKPADSHTPKLTVRQRHGKLFDELDLSSLDSLDPRVGRCSLLAPGQIPQCVLLGSCRIGVYSFYRAYHKGD